MNKILGVLLLIATPFLVVVGGSVMLIHVVCRYVGEVYRAWVDIVGEIRGMFK